MQPFPAASAGLGSAEGFRVLELAGADGSIADRPDPSIAVLDPRYSLTQEDSRPIGRGAIDQLWEKSGAGLRQWRNALVLLAPDAELWGQAEAAMREVMAYETVIAEAEKGRMEVSQLELKELRSRYNDKKESLRTSMVTAYRWVLYPEEDGLTVLPLPVPATKDERIVNRAIERLSDQDYGQPKILTRMGAVYFNSKVAPRLWKDDEAPLELGEAARRFPQWTFLPILPNREETLRACIREGIRDQLWAVAVGDCTSLAFQQLIQRAEDLDSAVALFDGSAALVKGELLDLLREELQPASKAQSTPPSEEPLPPTGTPPQDGQNAASTGSATIPAPVERYARVRIRVGRFGIGKTSNLQPYLFKVLQEQDAGAEVAITIEVSSSAGVSREVLEKRIVEAFDQLGIEVTWETS